MKHTGLVAWAAVVVSSFGILLLGALWPPFPRNALMAIALMITLFGVFGTFWMIFDVLRYEERPWKLLLGAVTIVFFFVWYYLDRARWRDESRRVPVALRRRGLS